MDLSILIPSRNEQFLSRTIEDILKHIEADTEVIALLDGVWANPGIPQDPRVNIIYVPESVGQREGTDMAARIARGKYVAKVDAHCSFDQGFDRKMLEAFAKVGDNVTMVPIMRNLHAFDWKCLKCGNRWYQGPTPTFCCSDYKNRVRNPNCDSTQFERVMTWKPRSGTHSTSYTFDAEPHFQYFQEYKLRPEYVKMKQETGLTESMSLQGSFFMATRKNYWKLKLGGDFGSWGNQGIQVALATWLGGGRVLVNHNTWYAHMFRTQGGDFSFPYNQSGRAVQKTKQKVWEFFTNGKWKRQIHPVSWLIERFWPVPGWNEQQLRDFKGRGK